VIKTQRNRIQHFEVGITVDQKNSLLAAGMSFVVRFASGKLMLSPNDPQGMVARIQRELGYFEPYVKRRLKEIGPELKVAKGKAWCPRCDCVEETLVLGDGDPRCLMCGYSAKPIDALCDLGLDGVIGHCPECGGACGDYSSAWVCFWCGTSFAGDQ
jgi:hypothetical protein